MILNIKQEFKNDFLDWMLKSEVPAYFQNEEIIILIEIDKQCYF